MDRLQTRSNYETQLKAELFKQLFLFQTELEPFNQDHFEHQKSIQVIIHSIDQLLEALLVED